MRLIAHRGLTGLEENSLLENHPKQIEFALRKDFEVECDVRYMDDKRWYLGHDSPDYEVSFTYLMTTKTLWLHCKNLGALEQMVKYGGNANYFAHDQDFAALTSKGYIWMLYQPNMPDRSIGVILDKDIVPKNCYGVCSKFVGLY